MKSSLMAMVVTALLSLGGIAVSFGDGTTHDLKALKEGESRVIAEGDAKVTATREGDVIHLVILDKEGKEHKMDVSATGKEAVLMSVAGHEGVHRIEVRKDGEGRDEKKVMVIATASGEPGDVMALDLDGDMGGFEHQMLWIDEDGTTHEVGGGTFLACPEGDTTMRVEKQEAGQTFMCPKHNLALVERKGHGMRKMIFKKEIETKESSK